MVNRFDRFDNYGLDHLLNHLQIIDNLDCLVRVVEDKEWHDCRKFQDPTALTLLGDIDLCLGYLLSKEEAPLAKLIRICFLRVIIEEHTLNTMSSPAVAEIIYISNRPALLERLAKIVIRQKGNTNLAVLFELCIKFSELGMTNHAKLYCNVLLEYALEQTAEGGSVGLWG